ncbi:putative serine esterase-domain-containing protein [Xylariaceae sp. FL0594]|nr:putative serine esterase-domain-containing protein [Xylariaceae sp. FL0594]
MTYPDQPFLPTSKKATEGITTVFKGENAKDSQNERSHHIRTSPYGEHGRMFQITSISLIGHSLGGLVQTYAIAYIQKHSPQFFDLIRPINFIALSSPFLGLSNENPLYVKFALDFGLVGRTGQDVGLTWRAPTIARSGWGALVGTLGETAHKKVMGESQPESKPLLRILPTGPAHVALKKFRNRTVYSNVVNDGIVPLRTSCLLFLDWQGLDRVEKARREAGLVGTVVGFGWAELTGTGMSARKEAWTPDTEDHPTLPGSSSTEETPHGDSHEVPQPSTNATVEDDRQTLNLATASSPNREGGPSQNSQTNNDSPFSGFLNLFKGSDYLKLPKPKSPSSHSPKEHKIYKRSQTLNFDDAGSNSEASNKSKVSSGHEFEDNQGPNVSAPPRTTFFESAGDLLNPKLPPIDFLLDPSKRPRTIFHDRVYHPSDIPPPPLKKKPTGSLAIRRRSTSHNGIASPNRASSGATLPPEHPGYGHQDSSLSARDYDDPQHTDPDRQPDEVIDSSSMKVEEKIARAYHRGLSWRKVLVNLEPDAHNNIIVRRMFANAFGWPVVKHLVDAHFSDDAIARTRDELETNAERAKGMDKGPDKTGSETKNLDDVEPDNMQQDGVNGPHKDTKKPSDQRGSSTFLTYERSLSLAREEIDTVPDLPTAQDSRSQISHSFRQSPSRLTSYDTLDSATWSDRDFADSADESDMDMDLASAHGRHPNVGSPSGPDEKALEKGKEKEEGRRRSVSPSAWNWTEKIVGKGAAARKSKGTASQSLTTSPTSDTKLGPLVNQGPDANVSAAH